MKALVVDDSASIRRIVVRTMNSVGVDQAIEAADGPAALSAFQADSFDLILLDWDLPKISGIEVLRAIRAAGSTVPVIMVARDSAKSTVLGAVQAGANAYLIKPFSPDQLAVKIRRVAPAVTQ